MDRLDLEAEVGHLRAEATRLQQEVDQLRERITGEMRDMAQTLDKTLAAVRAASNGHGGAQ